jgi:hypothetical protein
MRGEDRIIHWEDRINCGEDRIINWEDRINCGEDRIIHWEDRINCSEGQICLLRRNGLQHQPDLILQKFFECYESMKT